MEYNRRGRSTPYYIQYSTDELCARYGFDIDYYQPELKALISKLSGGEFFFLTSMCFTRDNTSKLTHIYAYNADDILLIKLSL